MSSSAAAAVTSTGASHAPSIAHESQHLSSLAGTTEKVRAIRAKYPYFRALEDLHEQVQQSYSSNDPDALRQLLLSNDKAWTSRFKVLPDDCLNRAPVIQVLAQAAHKLSGQDRQDAIEAMGKFGIGIAMKLELMDKGAWLNDVTHQLVGLLLTTDSYLVNSAKRERVRELMEELSLFKETLNSRGVFLTEAGQDRLNSIEMWANLFIEYVTIQEVMEMYGALLVDCPLEQILDLQNRLKPVKEKRQELHSSNFYNTDIKRLRNEWERCLDLISIKLNRVELERKLAALQGKIQEARQPFGYDVELTPKQLSALSAQRRDLVIEYNSLLPLMDEALRIKSKWGLWGVAEIKLCVILKDVIAVGETLRDVARSLSVVDAAIKRGKFTKSAEELDLLTFVEKQVWSDFSHPALRLIWPVKPLLALEEQSPKGGDTPGQ